MPRMTLNSGVEAPRKNVRVFAFAQHSDELLTEILAFARVRPCSVTHRQLYEIPSPVRH